MVISANETISVQLEIAPRFMVDYTSREDLLVAIIVPRSTLVLSRPLFSFLTKEQSFFLPST